MDGLSSAVNIISIIDTSIKVIKWCYDYADEFKHYKQERARLLQAVSSLKLVAEKVKGILKTGRGERLEASRELQDTTDNGKKRLKGLEDKLCKSGKFNRLMWPLKKQAVEEDIQAIEKCTQIIHQVLQVDIADILLDVDLLAKVAHRRAVIESLPLAEGAAFDSQAEQHNPGCLKNTRVELLAQIAAWIDSTDSKTIFWLNGMAGTGKSTISRTIAASAEKHDKLGASFFFKQGETDRGSLTKFFTTIARHLATTQPAYVLNLVEMISKDSTIFEKTSQIQFKRLIIDPLLASANNLPDDTMILVIVDALDECEKAEDIKLLVDLLSQAATIQKPQLRVFITSRPELPVRLGFTTIEGTYENCILHQMPRSVVEQDISIYLRHQLAKIKKEWNASVTEDRKLSQDWPDVKDIKTLAKKAAPLFIFAATMCRFVGDRKLGSPETQLQNLLAQNRASSSSKMGLVYSPALNQLVADVSEAERKDILRRFFRIVGTIICLASPLSTASLSRLLGTPRDEIDLMLDNLHSVLTIPSSPTRPVRMLHLSFRDYLLDRSTRTQNPFWVSGKAVSRYLVKKCFALMKLHLKTDICGVRSPGTCLADIPHQKISASLPSEVQYACLYWCLHLQFSPLDATITPELEDFFRNRLLLWMEALVLMGRAWQISGLLKTAQPLLENNSDGTLRRFIPDALRFLQANISVISSTPLQIYCGLAFTPENSIVGKICKSQIPKWITSKPSVETDWNSCLQVLEGHRELVNAVAFTPDSRLLISTSNDGTNRVWHWDTGECVHEFKNQESLPCSVVMSPDSRTVASTSSSGTIRIWSLTTGERLAVLGDDLTDLTDLICAIAFSPDSKYIYSLSCDMGVSRWNVERQKCIQQLVPRSGVEGMGVFSPNLKYFAFWTVDKRVEIRDRASGRTLIELTGYQRQVKKVIFSPDSKFIAILSDHSTFRMWNLDSPQKCFHQFKGHTQKIKILVFSPNSKVIASGSEDNSVRVWDVATGASLSHSLGFADGIEKLVFSPDSKFLAAASLDCTMVVYDWATDKSVGILQGHSRLITSMLFSPDSAVLTSFSMDQTIRIWDWRRGVDESQLHHDFGRVLSLRISPDSSLVATLSADKKLRIWSTSSCICIQELDWGKHLFPDYLSYFSLSSTIPFFSPGSDMVGLSPTPQTTRIWNIKSGDEVFSADACHPREFVLLFPSFDFQRCAMVPHGKETFSIWCLEDGRFVHQQDISTSGYETTKAIFTPDLNIVVASLAHTYGTGISFCAWNLATGKRLWERSIAGLAQSVKKSPIALSSDGFYTAAIVLEYLIVWQTATGNILKEITITRTPGTDCRELTFAPYRFSLGLLISETVQVWEWQSKKCTHIISEIGTGSRNLCVLGASEGIQTNLGECSLSSQWEKGPLPFKTPFHPELSFDAKTCWVQYRGKDLLRLPAECRNSIHEISGFKLVVGCQTGRVLIIGFDKGELEKSTGTPKQEPPPQESWDTYRFFESCLSSPVGSVYNSDDWSE